MTLVNTSPPPSGEYPAVFNLRKAIRNYKETGALSENVSIFGFIDDNCFITKNGDVGLILAVKGIDYECLDQRELDTTTKRLEAAFKLFGPEFRIYQYLFKTPFELQEPPPYDDPAVNLAEQERFRYFRQKADQLFSVAFYYSIVYSGPSTTTRMTLTKALASFFSKGPAEGMKTLQTLFSAEKEILLIEEEISPSQTALLRITHSFISQIADLVEINLLDKRAAFRMLRKLLNVDPQRMQHDQLTFDVLTDKFLVGAPIEAHNDHLQIEGYYTRILTLREEPSESWPLILQQLSHTQATYHIVSEWRMLDNDDARKHIETLRRHFHKTKESLSTTQGGDTLKDVSKVEFIDDLGECLKEIDKRGNHFGKFSLTIVIYSKDQAKVEKAVSDFYKAFSSKGGSLYYETYNQLSAYFATQPGNNHHNYRQLYITNNNYADWSFLFTLTEGERWNRYLNREALCTVETPDGTPFFLNLHQTIKNDSGNTDDVAHTLIVGKTGSGKSFISNFLTFSFQKYKPRTYIFDVGGSYEKLTNTFRGTYIKVVPEATDFHINPFSIEPTKANIEFLFAFVKVLIDGADYHTTNDDDRNLFQAITTIYDLDPGIRRLKTLAGTLPRHLAGRLDKWVEH